MLKLLHTTPKKLAKKQRQAKRRQAAYIKMMKERYTGARLA